MSENLNKKNPNSNPNIGNKGKKQKSDPNAEQIIANQIGTIKVTAYLALSPGEYSTNQLESGKILVVSKNDNFIFSF